MSAGPATPLMLIGNPIDRPGPVTPDAFRGPVGLIPEPVGHIDISPPLPTLVPFRYCFCQH